MLSLNYSQRLTDLRLSIMLIDHAGHIGGVVWMGHEPSDADVPFVTITEIVSLSRPVSWRQPELRNLCLMEGRSNAL